MTMNTAPFVPDTPTDVASLPRRYGAAAIDWSIYTLWMILFLRFPTPERGFIGLAVIFFLFILPEFTPKRATIGKRALKLYVSSKDGASWRRLLRSILKVTIALFFIPYCFAVLRFVTMQIGFALLCSVYIFVILGYLSIPFFNRNRQYLHDLLCSCVIRPKPVA